SVRELSAEIVREKCFEHLHQEIPFGSAVRILRFNEEDGPVVKLHLEVLVNKDNHRAIVVGREGSTLKKIGTDARKEIEKLMGRKVYLDLKVVAKRDWQKNPGLMKELGYVIPKS
ncbi:MAG TPA: KH domain-containing protein, partial [Bdellovibrionales bacterium]|nr:KH domain-containing protein [Bdellovibrionales bacterium]